MVIRTVIGGWKGCRRRLCRVPHVLLIMSAPAVRWSTRVFPRWSAIVGVIRRCSAEESRIGAAEDTVVFAIGETCSLILSDSDAEEISLGAVLILG